MTGEAAEGHALQHLLDLRQHQHNGQRAPHKPLLVLLALGRLAATGSSALAWSDACPRLAVLLSEFGPTSKTAPTQAAAYPFTRLRSDGLWTLDRNVPMDRIGPLNSEPITGRLTDPVERALEDRGVLFATVRALVEAEFPPTITGDVLTAVGFEPDEVYGQPAAMVDRGATGVAIRRRSGTWPAQILEAWDRQCAFCGYDGQLGTGSVGLEAAHVRWFNFDGPDALDNGLALCSLHHKLFDRGALGLTGEYQIRVSSSFTARTDAGRRIYDLAEQPLRPRPGTPLPATEHLVWHAAQVFKSNPVAA